MHSHTEFSQFWHCAELGGLELMKAQYQHKEFSRHVHEGYCINLIENGAQAFYRSGDMHVAPQGDIVLVNPDDVHTGSSAVEHGWGYRALYPTPAMIEHISQDFFGSLPKWHWPVVFPTKATSTAISNAHWA